MKTISPRHILLWALSALLLLLAGCSQTDMLQKFASPQEQSLAKGYVDLLRQQRFEDIEKAADPGIAGPTLHDTLVRMAAFLPAGEPKSVTLVGAHRMIMNDTTTVNTTFEYEYPGKWVLVNVVVKSLAGKNSVIGFSVVPQLKSLQEQNKFVLDGKAPLQYLVLAMVVMVPLLTLLALVLCIKTPFKGAKWPWVLFILFGVGSLSLNWSTGDWAFVPVAIQLFGAGAYAKLYGPWTFAVSLPLGAILFLLMRSRLRAPAAGHV